MRKNQMFYIFDEHTDFIAKCKKLGFTPVEYDDFYTDFVTKFSRDGKTYDVLGRNECWSGWEINIVPSEEFTFDSLLSILINTKFSDERFVSVGLLLKNHYNAFLAELKKDPSQDKFGKVRKKTAKFIIKDVCYMSSRVSEMEELIEVCKNICNS